MSNRPDAIVKEDDARYAIDRLTEGHVETQRDMGITMPDVAAAERFAQDAVGRQIKVHEERFKDGVPAPIERDDEVPEEGPGHVGSFRWNTATNQFTPIGDINPRLLEKTQQTAKGDPLLAARMEMLMQDMGWRAKIMRAWDDGLNQTGNFSGASDRVMAVVEASNNVFGDWRTPRERPRLILVG